eukprot:15052779-Ditylum_brightwellii.AAC.1
MVLSKEKVWDKVGLSDWGGCNAVSDKVGLSDWDGCNADYESTLEGPGLDDLEGTVSGIGLVTDIQLFTVKTHVTHESTDESTDTESTSIGFTLGDDEP